MLILKIVFILMYILHCFLGFGFVAGSEKPVIIRSVVAGNVHYVQCTKHC